MIKYLVSGIVGFALGVLCRKLYFKKNTQSRLVEDIEDEYFEPIVVPLEYSSEPAPVETIIPKETTGAFDGGNPMRDYRNYSDIYAADQYPTEDEDYIDDAEGELLTKEREESKGPRIMEWEEIGMPGLDEIVLIWHIDERWMETEDGEIIDDPFALVGDCLQSSGFDISNQRSIHIINERRGETYEVLKVTGRSM